MKRLFLLASAGTIAVVLLSPSWAGGRVTYKLQETIRVPVLNPAGVLSTKRLLAGKPYLLRASGSFFTGEGTGPGYGDAEFVNNGQNGHVIDRCRDGVDLGVGIDDTNVAPGHRKNPRWGAFSPKHSYSVRIVGAGTRIRVDYHDCYYGDNRPRVQQAGTQPLIVSVYAPK